MLFNLVKKTTIKNGKKFINFMLVNSENKLIIPVEVKVFKDKEGKILPSSVFSWNLANRCADWITGSDSKKEVE